MSIQGIDKTSFTRQSFESPIQENPNFLDQPKLVVKQIDKVADLFSTLSDKESFRREIAKALTHDSKITIDLSEDFEDLAHYSSDQNKYGGPASDQNRFEAPVTNYFDLRLSFVEEVFSDLQADLQDLSDKFLFRKDEISGICFKSSGADTHNRCKSTVLIEIELKNREKIAIFYKPRSMYLEWLVCDVNEGLFSKLISITGITELADPKIFSYPVISKEKEGRSYGYSKKIEGQVLYDETEKMTDSTSITSPHFMQPGVELMSFEFNSQISQLDEEQQTERNALLDKSFFSCRTDEELKSDYLLFYVLSLLELGDLHGGNFILSRITRAIIPIDLECLQKDDARNVFIQISHEMKRRQISIDDEVLKQVSNFVEKLNLNLAERPLRVVLIATEKLCKYKKSFLIGNKIPAFSQFYSNIFPQCDVLNKEKLTELMANCFNRLDIPFFNLEKDIVYFEGEPIGKLKPPPENLDLEEDESATGGEKFSSVEVHEDVDQSEILINLKE